MKGAKETSCEETRSSKRHRTKTNRYEIDFLDNDEQKHIQQAMRNSLVETRRIDIPTPSAPTFYPTVEEFHDVLKYISKIRPVAEEFGICKIVPPKGWNPTCQIDLSDVNPKIFSTKLQDISTLQQGEGFEDGKVYTFASYRKMADQFTVDWLNKHHGGKKIPEQVSYEDLARDYWDIVETHTKQAIVEYGNDLDTDVFMSGFPIKKHSISAATSPNNTSTNNGDVNITTGSSSPYSANTDTDNNITTTATNDSIFNEEYYINSGWNLTQLPGCSGSVLQHITTPINGVNVPWLYVGMLFSSFCWHNEDNYLFSMNYSHYGAPKQWYGVPGSDTKRFEKVSKDFLLESFQESPDLLQHMTTQISPSLLQANGVNVYKILQEAQTFIITFPKAFHCGFNHGFNINEAVNFATPDWLRLGAEAEEKYRLIARGSVFSHQRLLFTLLHHLQEEWENLKQKKLLQIDTSSNNNTNNNFSTTTSTTTTFTRTTQAIPNTTSDTTSNTSTTTDATVATTVDSSMSLKYQQALANEIFKVVDEELVTRPVIVAQGIKDISQQVKLPPNDFVALSKKALEYDDMRTCCVCKHICVFSAIACECDRAKVTCIRHFNYMCKCTRDKKFLLKWASDDYLRDIKKQMLRIIHNVPGSGPSAAAVINNTCGTTTIQSQSHTQQQILTNTVSTSST